jgi:glutaredoxin
MKYLILLILFLFFLPFVNAIYTFTPRGDCNFSWVTEEERLIKLNKEGGLIEGKINLAWNIRKECGATQQILFMIMDGKKSYPLQSFEVSLNSHKDILEDKISKNISEPYPNIVLDLKDFFDNYRVSDRVYLGVNYSYFMEVEKSDSKIELTTATLCGHCENYHKVFVLPANSEVITSPSISTLHKREGRWVVRFENKQVQENLIIYKDIKKERRLNILYNVLWVSLGAMVSIVFGLFIKKVLRRLGIRL